MKVVAILGSPRKKGNTATGLQIMREEFEKQNIAFEVLNLGQQEIRGCIACNKCFEMQNNTCIIQDVTNKAIQKMTEADGIILTSPVYWSGIAGTIKCFLDRAFLVSTANGNLFRGKVGTAFVCARRTGGSQTLAGLYNYLTYSEMIVPTSNYWNVIHGEGLNEVLQDQEGIQILQVLARNMIWMLQLREKGLLKQPEAVPKIMTNFIR